MQSGSIARLKEEIVRSFRSQYSEFEKEETRNFEADAMKIKESHLRKAADLQARTKEEVQKAYQSALSLGILTAKKEYEQEREKLIAHVFDVANGKRKQVMETEEYLNRIRAVLLPGSEIIGNMRYQKDFPGMLIDDSVDGIIIRKEEKLLDFCYSHFVSTRKSEIRSKVTGVLF